ncbi:hypothetical protein PMAYCL1PPCAC_20626, partial [Pristionchus mayeri]
SSADKDDLLVQMTKLDAGQDSRKWLEKKIHEQSDLTKAFVDCNASGAKVEEERKMEHAIMKCFLSDQFGVKAIQDNGKGGKEEGARCCDASSSNPFQKVNMNISSEPNIASGK